jgi:hypothetical protein
VKITRTLSLLIISFLFVLSQLQGQKHGFYVLQEDRKGEIELYQQHYSIDPKLIFSFQLLDTAFGSFDHNGYPLLLLRFKKTDSVAHMLSYTNRQLAMFYNDSLKINAKMLGFDSSYALQLSGVFSLQEVRELERITLTAIHKYTPPQRAPSFKNEKVTDSAILKPTLQQFNSLAALFIKALQQKKYALLSQYFFDSSAKKMLITKLTKKTTEETARKEVDKIEPHAKKYFDQLVENNTINWKLITLTDVTYQKLTFFPELDFYIADVYINFLYDGEKRKLKFDELLYMDGKWLLFLEDITVK